MICVAGKPLLLWNVEQFKKHGVEDFFITLYHLPEVIRDFFGDGSRFGVNIRYSVEKEPLGSAGGIKNFTADLDDLFYFMYGDMFGLMDYTKMAKAYAEKANPIGMQRMEKTENYDDADVAVLDSTGAVAEVHAKPHASRYPNAYRMRGSFILSKRILDYIPQGIAYNIGRQLIPEVVNAHEKFYAYECDDYSKGIDTKEKWKEVEEYVKCNNITVE